MIQIKNYLFFALSGVMLTNVYAKTLDTSAYSLMTATDMKANISSNITIVNRTGQAIPSAGLFIAAVDSAANSDNCSVCTGAIIGGDNLMGAVLSPVDFKVNAAAPIGQNYLYNMIYNAIYFINKNALSPCALPGCSWPSDTPTQWCLSFNAISRHASYTFSTHSTANSPPYGEGGNSIPFEYKYDLFNPNQIATGNPCIGPVTCNDKTLTCTVSTPQSASFEPYSN